jgi:alpha/beta hydrolase family protein
MRFRRIAAIGSVVTAVLATTAAVLPSTPVDKPQPMPALTTQALAARYATDSRMIARAASTARKAGNTAVATELKDMSREHFIDFNPRGAGLAVEVIGNLATATRVVVIVPGSSTSLATFDTRGTASPGGGAAALAAQTHRLDPGNHLAIIAWLGYNTPSMLSTAVMTSGDAGQGAQALRPFVDYLAGHGKQVALICHSYGAVVCGLAARNLPVTDIAVIASPGMDASSVKALHTRARVWAGRGASDPIQYVPHIHFLGLGFGQDPMDPAFGARIFACGSGGHSSYFQPGGIALRNLAYIALGDSGQVTR